MLSNEEANALADFFLDGAKIIFASLVVGIFVPGAAGARPWLTFLMGLVMTSVFLGIAVKLAKTEPAAR
ncbi:MAG: hypothetical protein A3G87_02885 [Omnitrophica bacterium RIFCSPLOWO2_12_FULL_50_11]|nr:MAG: hypothetical protein A3G87_02885 [Omnitrophica bacterium RIFCSPLOWO2_12_FULL_50_11]